MGRLWLLLCMAGCYQPPELPLVDEVPLVPVGSCAPNRNDWVSCVLDGDTFDIDSCGNGERVRLLGIDAPEIAHEGDPAECYSAEAQAELRSYVENSTVLLTFDQDCFGLYGRTLAYVWVQEDGGEPPEDGPDERSLLVNEELLLDGFARLFDEDFGDPLRLEDRLADAQAEAQARGLGLWSECETPQ